MGSADHMEKDELEAVINDILESTLPKIQAHVMHIVGMRVHIRDGDKTIPNIQNTDDFLIGIAYGSILAHVESYFRYTLRREMELMERLEFVRIMDQKYKYIIDEIQGLKKSNKQ